MFGSLSRLTLTRAAPVVRAQFSTSVKRQGGGGGWSYRTLPPHTTDFLAKASQGIMIFTWWWIFHGIFTEPAHILPFWDNYPDPTKWTDKQLGIPADDEE